MVALLPPALLLAPAALGLVLLAFVLALGFAP